MVKRMWRYLGPSLLLAVIMNISKFFELTIIQHEDGTYGYDLTPLRRDTTYSAVTNWLRLIFMGAVPLVIIIFFNFKVYQDVRERSLRNFRRKSTKFPKSSAKIKVRCVLLSCKDSTFLDSLFSNQLPKVGITDHNHHNQNIFVLLYWECCYCQWSYVKNFVMSCLFPFSKMNSTPTMVKRVLKWKKLKLSTKNWLMRKSPPMLSKQVNQSK